MNKEFEEFCIEGAPINEARPVVERLRNNGLSVVTAESCTAGLIAAVLTHVPGAGDCFQGAFVAYSKEHKVAALGVNEVLLREKGSVNPEVAEDAGNGDDGNWTMPGRDYSATRFSPLHEISIQTVNNLQVACTFSVETARGQESAPIVVDLTSNIREAASRSSEVPIDSASCALQHRFVSAHALSEE